MCERWLRPPRRVLRAVMGVLGTLCFAFVSVVAHADTGESPKAGAKRPLWKPMLFAEAAVLAMAKGDFSGAARQTRLAMQAAPGDANTSALAGIVLLNTGNPHGARTAFQNAVACDESDPFLWYGLGLSELGGGDRNGALRSFARSAQLGGDPSYLLVAQRYAQWLGGAQVAIEGAALPEALVPAQQALAGMAARKRGETAQAAAQLQAALERLPGDPITEPGGVLMSFAPDAPLLASAPPLAAKSGLDTPLPRDRALQGVVRLAPSETPPGTAYVAFDLDGESLGLINGRPLELSWDTRRATNGWHSLAITILDERGVKITQTTRRILTLNPTVPGGDDPDAERMARLKTAFWQALTLQPDRFACASALGRLYRQQGNLPLARQWLRRALAVRPESAPARQELVACGGLSPGGDTVWGGLNNEKIVALTFDDGPKPGVTEPLLDVLVEQQVPATFFVIGKHVSEYPELTRKMAAVGMELANHSYTHRSLTHLSEADIAREILQTQAAVQMATGQTMRYLRPPGGNWNPTVAGVAKRWGLTACMWTVDVYGSEVIGAQQVAEAVLEQVRPGSIILMHNGKLSTLAALPTIVRELRRRGYTFATVDALARRLALAQQSARVAAQVSAQKRRHAE